MKFVLGVFIAMVSVNAFASDDLSAYTPERIRAIAAQANADYESLVALEKEFDVRMQETIIIEKNAQKDLEALQEVDLRDAEEGSKEIEAVTEKTNIVIEEVENNIESRSNKRQGFGIVE